jgi:hypothetical protein
LTVEQLQKNHGGGIIGNLYDNLFDAISAVYPEYVWHAWLFDSAPHVLQIRRVAILIVELELLGKFGKQKEVL